MIDPKYVAAAAILVAPLLIAGGPAKAFTARQATAQGQGIFVTSSGAPQNLIPSGPVSQQANDGNRRAPLRSAEHHDRYFAEF